MCQFCLSTQETIQKRLPGSTDTGFENAGRSQLAMPESPVFDRIAFA